jgi:hypothetical protein
LVDCTTAVLTARNRLAIDDAGARGQFGGRLDNQKEAVCQVIARSAVELYPRAILAGDQAEAVVLDIVQSLGARGRAAGAELGRHGAMKPARKARERENMGPGGSITGASG